MYTAGGHGRRVPLPCNVRRASREATLTLHGTDSAAALAAMTLRLLSVRLFLRLFVRLLVGLFVLPVPPFSSHAVPRFDLLPRGSSASPLRQSVPARWIGQRVVLVRPPIPPIPLLEQVEQHTIHALERIPTQPVLAKVLVHTDRDKPSVAQNAHMVRNGRPTDAELSADRVGELTRPVRATRQHLNYAKPNRITEKREDMHAATLCPARPP